MKSRIVALILLLASALPCAAQSVTIWPTAPIAPRGTTQDVTAVVVGVNNKTGAWTVNHGATLTGNTVCVANGPCSIGVYDATAETDTLTFTPTNGAVSPITSSLTFTASPTPVTSQPHEIITAAMLSSLQAKGVSTNPIYEAVYNQANAFYTADAALGTFSTWNGSACTGGSWPSSSQYNTYKEGDANFMAFVALNDTSSTTRDKFGCAARDVLVYVMAGVTNGSEVISGNRWSDSSVPFAVTPNWLMARYLSSSDMTTTRAYAAFLCQWVQVHGNGYSPPAGPYNSPTLYQSGSTPTSMRQMGDNYVWSKVLILAALGLAFNDTTTDPGNGDYDPPLANTCSATRYQVCTDYSAGSLHAYGIEDISVYLYLEWARLVDPAIAQQAYYTAYGAPATIPTNCLYESGATIPCFGDQQGGESSEGFWYDYSQYRFRWALNIIHTAGYDDPLTYGPQISVGTASWWDQKYVVDESILTSFNFNNYQPGQTNYNGYNYFTTGDSNEYVRQIQDFSAEAATMTADSYIGRTDRTNALWWGVYNAVPGLGQGTAGSCSGALCGFDANIGSIYSAFPAMFDTFITQPATDPETGTQPTDPRSAFPTDLFNLGQNQHQMVRNNWSQGANTVVSITGDIGQANHEHTDDGGFLVYSNGEFITKPRMPTDDYNPMMVTGPSSNTISVPNPLSLSSGCTPGCIAYYSTLFGGPYDNGQAQAYPTIYHSELPAYTDFTTLDTGLYNGYWTYNTPFNSSAYVNVTSGSRDILYLRGSNRIITYDRTAQNPLWTISGSVSSGAFYTYENVTQAGSGATGNIYTAPTGSAVMLITALSGSPDNSHLWTGASSGAVYAPSTTPTSYYAGSQSVNLITTGAATISSNTASWLTQSAAQKAYYTTLLPSSPTYSVTPLPTYLVTSAAHSSLNSSSTMQMTCTVYNADGTNSNISSSANVLWTSSNTEVATISSTGLVTPVTTGTTDIGCSYVPLGPASSNQSYGLLTVVSGSSSGSWTQINDLAQTADWEVVDNLSVTASATNNTQFLGVLEWGASGFSKTSTTLVQSSAGQGFDGSLIGSSLVMFMRAWPVAFTGVTYPASGATTQYVSDLTPNTTYAISGTGAPTSGTTDTAGVLTFAAAGTGNVTVGSGSGTAGSTFRGVQASGVVIQ